MLQSSIGYLFAFLCAVIVIAGDVVLKVAAERGTGGIAILITIGCVLYAASAITWFFAMQHVSLAQAGVAYAMFNLLALCAIGALYFGETLGPKEIAGILCALAAIVLLVEFS